MNYVYDIVRIKRLGKITTVSLSPELSLRLSQKCGGIKPLRALIRQVASELPDSVERSTFSKAVRIETMRRLAS